MQANNTRKEVVLASVPQFFSMATVVVWRIHVTTHVVEKKLNLIGFTRSLVTSLMKNSKVTSS